MTPLPSGKRATTAAATRRDEAERAAILESSINLIQGAALKPGGDNFRLATQKLNQYFEGTSLSEYQLSPESQAFLSRWLPPEMVEDLQKPHWSESRDARHLEDCMMYYGIANRVGGVGDDLARVSRVFDWIVKQVQLVPPGSLGSHQASQVYSRPYDLLLRGMGTESQGYWAERAWMFMALCRQLGVDVGLLTYSKGNVVEPLISTRKLGLDATGLPTLDNSAADRPPIIWVCAALIGDEAYLFDARVGLPIPGPNGEGVATLKQALADPAILDRMDLPGLAAYETSRASLLASPTKIGVLLDSSQGYFTPKMKMLQAELSGGNRTILFRDPVEERDRFVEAMGDRLGEVDLWTMPLEVETRLFTDPDFVAATQQSLFFFRGEMPLLYARIKQLRGDLAEAVSDYVSFRFSDTAKLVTDKDVTIPAPVQEGLDVYATYYLALAHLERENLDQAELMFRKTLEMLPEPGPGQPFYYMFRWGAHANLGRIYEAMGDPRRAIAHYT
ncbi:MAG: tetratricopeptide repeat protein, partial [Actinomycetota bacterium]|nr:tetratricopeptide repeat protein [Actinomycetota bacterium]